MSEKKYVRELMNSLQTYELQVLDDDHLSSLKKGKSIACILDRNISF